jgi:hypothetical protein
VEEDQEDLDLVKMDLMVVAHPVLVRQPQVVAEGALIMEHLEIKTVALLETVDQVEA